mmetsp:Transcript_1824/g.4298  ORF Transcript_1824/g.4298 Transcript_1824/m.4298 type:complete len:393 (-) Transcript_1824:76-1254(-)
MPSSTTAATTNGGKSTSTGTSFEAVLFMSLLALQFGMQPALTRKYTPVTTCRSAVVITQECVKFGIAMFMLFSSGQAKAALEGWSIYSWLTVAFVPAALYVVQNLSALMAYQNLHPVTFNVLNQTKTLSAALCCFLIIGRKQSKAQVFSLFLLLLSALVIERIVTLDFLLGGGAETTREQDDDENFTLDPRHFTHGVIPVLVASFISGLAGAITQKNLQGASGCGKAGGKNAVLFSAELCIASLIMLGGSLTFNSDGVCIKSKGFFADWTPYTFIPILTNALGGILVGLVTKYAGSVRKGFALIFGLILSGIIQAVTERSGGGSWAISTEEILGGILASISLWIHVTNPYKEPITEKIDTRANGSQKKVTNGVATSAPAKASRRSRKSRKED